MGIGKNKRTRKRSGDPEDVPMTPMIDIVFQLLVYFIFTFDPVSIFTHMDITRPSSDSAAKSDDPPPEMYEIMIQPRRIPFGVEGSQAAYSLNKKKAINLEGLEQIISRITPEETITMLCDTRSLHNDLVAALNLCTKHKLTNVNVLSTK